MALRTEAALVVARLAWRQLRRGSLIWGGVFALTIVSSVWAYDSTYGTPAERAQLLAGLAKNAGMRAMFGPAREIDTMSGFLAWRTVGMLPLVAGVWGILVATRALRGEEDNGRWATILSAPISRTQATLAALCAVAAGSGVIFGVTAATLAGVALTTSLPVAGGLWLALALCIAAPAFAAVGALTAQLAATRREAAALASAVFAVAFVLRVAGDGSSATWLVWATPIGWIEELRPLTGAQLAPLAPLLLWIVAFTTAAVWIAARRDDGASLLPHSDTRAPRHVLISSPAAFSLRESLGGVVGWALGLGATAFMFGALSDAIARLARDSAGLREHVEATTRARIDITSAHGYLSIVFALLAVALALYGATHASAAREEEAAGRLDTLLGQPVGRRRWLAGRLVVASLSCAALAAWMGLCAWAGARMVGGAVSLASMLEGALNVLPVVLLFLGLGALALAVVPRHTGAAAFGAVTVAYLWEQTGALVDAPDWVVAVSPFHWLALVPSQPVDVRASGIMLVIGVSASSVALERFRRRDIAPA